MDVNDRAELDKYSKWIANMVRSHPELAGHYFEGDIPEGISLKELPNYDRFQIEHMKLNTIDENCKMQYL